MLPIWYSPLYTEGLDPEARFPRERYCLVWKSLAKERSNGTIRIQSPGLLDPGELATVHDLDYRDAFLNGELSEEKKRRIGLRPWTEIMVERTLRLTQGTVSATRWVCENGGMAANLGGGTHHAYRDFGSGYCIFNDLGVAARVAQRDYGLERVLILDLDVHQGDGTAAIFEDDPSVETVSFHCGKNFPFRKMTSDLDVIFEEHTGDEPYLEKLSGFLEGRKLRPLPDLILFQAGVDSLTTDRLGHLAMSPEGMRERNRRVYDFAEELEIPLVITMGGGYGEPIETSIRSHADVFRQASERGG